MESYGKRLMRKLVLDAYGKIKIENASDNLFNQYLESYMDKMPDKPEFVLERGYESDASIRYGYTVNRNGVLEGEIKGERYIEFDVNNGSGMERSNTGVIFGFIAPHYRISQRFDTRSICNDRIRKAHDAREITSMTFASKDIGSSRVKHISTTTSVIIDRDETDSFSTNTNTFSTRGKNRTSNEMNIETHAKIYYKEGEPLICIEDIKNQGCKVLFASAFGMPGVKLVDVSDEFALAENYAYYQEILSNPMLCRKTVKHDYYQEQRIRLLLEHLGTQFSDDMGVEVTEFNNQRVYSKPIIR